jgi:iron complex outermembrane receptor protein
LDPSGAAVPNATVSIGATEQPTDDLGVATFCNLGDGPHSVVVLAQGLAAHEQTLTQSTGEVRIQLALSTVTEQIVVIGSRTEGRAVLESAVPVDIVSAEDFTEQGDPDLVNQLRNTVPSFNVSANPISDAGTIVRPASLRNLAPDHTLLLVNGKRRHRAAIIHWISVGPTDGAQGPDLAVIPSIALRQAEVLRDGASAQYGSDAIAGVMNFVLKDASSGGSMQVTAGGYGAGDGENVTFAGNVGLPLGEGGFANLSIEYGNTDPTDRAIQRYDAQQLIANGNTHVRSPTAQVWGSPRIDDDVKFWGNFGKFVGGTTQFYAHTNYASKRVDGGFYFRNPHTRSAVYSGDGGNTLLVGDVLDAQDGILDGSAGCPTVRVSDGAVLDPGNFAEVKRNPNCFTFHQPFAGAPDGKPGGFTPQFGGDMIDSSLVGGLRGTFAGGVVWDASMGVGSNAVDFFIYNTVNASMGPESPTSFDPGKYTQQETNFNFDLSYAASDNVHLATGTEWRNEKFTIGQGDPASYTIGPYAAQGFSSASNGFNGFGPIAAGEWNRSNYAVYGDIEIGGPDSPYTLAGALRGERFADFGSTLNYKIAARVEATEGFAVRGSASSGFRAPTPGQQNAFNVSTVFSVALGDLTNDGTIPSTSPAAALVGGGPLEAEKSRNYTAGAIFDKGQFGFTADYFRVDLRDRLWLTRNFQLAPAQVDSLIAQGITSARNLANFRFFTNQIDTSSQGIDLVATYAPAVLDGDTVFSLVLNHTKTAVVDFDPEHVGPSNINVMENAFPESRWNVAVRHKAGKFRLLVRLSYWGDFFDKEDGRNYPGDYLADIEGTFMVAQGVSVSIGGQNIFNNYPTINPGAFRGAGNLYPQATPYGFNGGYYYMRLNYTWDQRY